MSHDYKNALQRLINTIKEKEAEAKKKSDEIWKKDLDTATRYSRLYDAHVESFYHCVGAAKHFEEHYLSKSKKVAA